MTNLINILVFSILLVLLYVFYILYNTNNNQKHNNKKHNNQNHKELFNPMTDAQAKLETAKLKLKNATDKKNNDDVIYNEAKKQLNDANIAVAAAPTLKEINSLKEILDNLTKQTTKPITTPEITINPNIQIAIQKASKDYTDAKSKYDSAQTLLVNAKLAVKSAPTFIQITINNQNVTIAQQEVDNATKTINMLNPATIAKTIPSVTLAPANTLTQKNPVSVPEPVQQTDLDYNSGINALINQYKLKSLLETTITNVNEAIVIKDNFKDNFKDIDTGSIILPKTNTDELNAYTDSYNNSIALLDDPNQLNKVAFDTYIYLQEKKLSNLKTDFDKLKTSMDSQKHAPTPIKGLKSMHNSNILNVESYPNPNITQSQIPGITNPTNVYSGNGAIPSNYPNYLIYGNNGCLQFKQGDNTKTPIESSSFDFQSCNANNNLQQFKVNRINNKIDYNSLISQKNSNYVINDESSTQFGFYVVNPMTDNKQCLQLNNDGLSIMPCTMEKSQRFKPTYHSVLD